ncbi:hypothetical protein C2845_PM15G04520 [Panicum miliaceum]|uniref:Uncharacterized protein n=1 Tax=Panicum miliaceum TaxID=4540 RepID=A0A3L6QBK1_PANMI|nr:hypothetical protein C2845_PM15G04520 [Panicum miliaceum]
MAKNLRVLLQISGGALVSVTGGTPSPLLPRVGPAIELTDWLTQFALSSASPTSSPWRSVLGRQLSLASLGPVAGSRFGPSRSGGTATARSLAAAGRSSWRPPASKRVGSWSSATAAAACSPSRLSTPAAAYGCSGLPLRLRVLKVPHGNLGPFRLNLLWCRSLTEIKG